MKTPHHLLVGLLIALVSAASVWQGQVAQAGEPVSFSKDVVPVLQIYCVGCHSVDDAQGGLAMDRFASLMEGGHSGPAITPGVADSSRLLLMASGRLEPVMPPDGMEGPNEQELKLLADWIDQGAKGPAKAADGHPPQMIQKLRVPELKPSDDAVHPITAIAVSPQADRRAIARFGEVQIDRIGPAGKSKSNEPQQLLEVAGKINSLRFSADGQRLLVASGLTGAYGLASLIDLNSSEQARLEMIGHRDTLYSAEFSPDESLVATAGYDSEIVLWDASTGKSLRKLTGHNGAIFDLAFSPDGNVLASACADETVKLWSVQTGERLDTLGQSEGEVYAVDFTPNGQKVIAVGADNRLRVWRFAKGGDYRSNPLSATRFIDASPLTGMILVPASDASELESESSDGLKGLVVLSEAGALKWVEPVDWNPVAELPPIEETGSDLAISPDGRSALISLMDGQIVRRQIPLGNASVSQIASQPATERVTPVWMEFGELHELKEPSTGHDQPSSHRVRRGVRITGQIERPGEVDRYTWRALAGEKWAIDADASAKNGSKLDPLITVTDQTGQAVTRVRLQAVRDTYFTFRGKDSQQVNDFRLFAWQEMNLNEYLYSSGEVTRLWHYPDGPDSGFTVYPGQGRRLTYYGTTHTTHALGEPGFIVRPLQPGEPAAANGLPVFDIPYQNDDDPQRIHGKNSRLIFTAPRTGTYTIEMEDARGGFGRDCRYQLTLRPAQPDFCCTVEPISKPLRRGTGREFQIKVERIDEFDGPIEVFAEDHLAELIPDGVQTNLPLVIEPGQTYATGLVWVPEDFPVGESFDLALVARAEILGRRVEHRAGSTMRLTVGQRPSVIPTIVVSTAGSSEDSNASIQLRRGETIVAKVRIDREEDFTDRVKFGKAHAARNAPFGVYVDNVGLNGLLVRESENEREFFLTADPLTQPSSCWLHLEAAVDGGVTSRPIRLQVLP